MEQIALIAGEHVIYWKNLMLAAAVVCAIVWFFALYVKDRRTLVSALLAVPLMIFLSVYVSRFIHWYCHPSHYESFKTAISDLSTGDFVLIGVFISIPAVVALLRLLRIVPKPGRMLDSLAIAGSAGIGIGRLASFFNTSCRGPIVPNFRLYPVIFPMTDPVSGQIEYRLATFLLQSAAAWIIFGVMLTLRARDKRRKGDLWLVFLVLYGASQILLDSTRYDPLSFRSNGFVSIIQAMSAVALVLAAVVFSVRMVKARGLRPWAFGLWLGILGAIGGVAYMEYYVQRHGYKAVFAYSCMTVCLIITAGLILLIRRLSFADPKAEKKEDPYYKKSNRKVYYGNMNRKLLIAIIAVALLAAVLVAVYIPVNSRYAFVCGQMVERDVPAIDLRDQDLTYDEYRAISRKLPNTLIIWNVPFQGGYLSSNSSRISVSSLTMEDLEVLDCFPKLSRLDAQNCTDYDALMAFREKYPDCSIIYYVSVGGVEYPYDAQLLEVRDPSCEELEAMLPYLTEVTSVHITGKLPEAAQLYAMADANPHIRFGWDVAAGEQLLSDQVAELDLQGTSLDAGRIGDILEYLPKLEQVDLRGGSLSEPELRALADRFPDCFFLWDLRFGDFTFPTDSEEIDISGMAIGDPSEVEALLPYFPRLKKVVMSHCGLDDETMAALDSRHEDIRFVWSIQIKNKFLRTDATFFYPLKLFGTSAVYVNDEDIYPLRYCVDMVCIDIGHHFGVTNCEWAAFMPNLEFLVIGETNISDLTPLSSCKKLKFLEMFTIPVEDYSPLVECTGLEDLNLGKTYCDPAPIAKMTWLKNLWWCGVYGTVGKPYSNAHIILAEALPDTFMKFSLAHPVASGWRQLENYYAMRDILGMFYLT